MEHVNTGLMGDDAQARKQSIGTGQAGSPDIVGAFDKEPVSFDDLVRAHSEGNASAYQLTLAAFSRQHGTVKRLIYGSKNRSGVALMLAVTDDAQKRINEAAISAMLPARARSALKVFGVGEFPGYEVDFRFNPETRATILALQNECEYYRVQRYRVRRTQYEEMFAQRLFDAAQAVMQLDNASAHELPDKIAAANTVVDDVRQRYEWIQNRVGSLSYLLGLLIGVVGVAVPLLIWVVFAALLHGNLTVALCMLGGAVAAAANSMFRLVQGVPTVKGEDSRTLITIFAAFRPALGAIFALIAYALVVGGFLPVKSPTDPQEHFWFVIGISFIAGFTEGFTPDLIERASHQLTPSGPTASRPSGANTPTGR